MKKRQARKRAARGAQQGVHVRPKDAALEILLEALETGCIGNQPLTADLMIQCAAAAAPYFAPKLKPRRG